MIIGFKGYKQSGKTTSAMYLCQEHGFKRANFKDGLVSEILDNLPDVLIQLGHVYNMKINELFEQKPPVMRALMQNYGTDLRRKENPDYWVKQWEEMVANLQGNIVVDDVRFKNEAEAVRKAGGIIVEVVNSDSDHIDLHVSETEGVMIEADFTIECRKGDLECIYKNIESILSDISAD